MKRLCFFMTCLILAGCNLLHPGELGDSDEVVEKLDVVCTSSVECEVPFGYAIRSDCPYVSRCISGRCTVVCPDYFECVEDYKKIVFENKDGGNLSASEITEAIFTLWLEYHHERKSCSLSWIEDFEIHEVFVVSEDDNKIMSRVNFSVLPTDIRDSNWIPGNGDIEGDWVKNKLLFVTLSREGDTYLIESLGTGP